MPHRGRKAGAASNRLRRVILVPKSELRDGRAPLRTRPDRAPYLTNTNGLRIATKKRLKGVNYTNNEKRQLVVIFLKSVKIGKANVIYTIAKQIFKYQAKKAPRTSEKRDTNKRLSALETLTKEEFYKGVNEIKKAIN